MICGESECRVRPDRMFPFEVSKEHNALFLYLEHRYYGASQPFETHSTENLRFLTSRHALADMAVFLDAVNAKLMNDFEGDRRKVLVIGGSYPGAMSAWFRAKYPHVADGSWASSAVVNAVEDFDMFDYQIFNSSSRSSEVCAKVISDMTAMFDSYVEAEDKENVDKIKGYFEATALPDGDFAFYFADLFVGPIQYGNRTILCEFLEQLKDVPDMERYERFAEFTKGSHKLASYDREQLKEEAIEVSKSSRQWTYQYCTEFGYFQTPHKDVYMRSRLLNLDFWREYCSAIFKTNIVTRADETNVEFGSVDIRGTNIFFTNGGEDPWQWASVNASQPVQNNLSITYQCENCAHCFDLHTEQDTDPELLKDTREQIRKWIRIVLYGHLE